MTAARTAGDLAASMTAGVAGGKGGAVLGSGLSGGPALVVLQAAVPAPAATALHPLRRQSAS